MIFSKAGVTDNELKDSETAKFIYDFVEKHGGVESFNAQGGTFPDLSLGPGLYFLLSTKKKNLFCKTLKSNENHSQEVSLLFVHQFSLTVLYIEPV